jgi:hypothetical protein
MRVLTGSVLAIVLVGLLGCQASGLAGSTPPPTATLTPQQAPGATPTLAASATPAPPVQPQVEGPLGINGQPLTAVVAAPGSPVRYGVLGEGLARSDNRGQAWQRVSDVPVVPPVVSPRDPATLYAGDMASCYKDGSAPIFRRSTDGGHSWEELEGGLGIKPVAAIAGEGGHDRVYGINCEGMHLSADSGQTWELTAPTLGLDITSVLPVTNGSLRFLAVLTSEGGSSHLAWFDESGALMPDLVDGLNFWGLGVLAQVGSTLYVGDSTGVWRQREPGADWERSAQGLEDVVLEADPMTEGLSEADASRGFGLFALAPDPANPERLALGTVRGLYLSEDAGETWSPAGIQALAESRINQVVWEAGAANTLYVTTPGGVFVVRLP